MKSKLYLAGLVSLSCLTYSCSSDDESYEAPQAKTTDFGITTQAVLRNESKVKTIDSTAVKLDTQISTTREEEGDPNNPLPPR